MQNRSGYDQVISMLMAVRSKKDRAAILASVREQHGDHGVEIINQLLAKAKQQAETEIADLKALSAICDRAEAKHPNDILEQASAARRGITFFVNSKNNPANTMPELTRENQQKHSM